MEKEQQIAIFEGQLIRRVFFNKEWRCSVEDIDQTILSDALHVNRYFYLSCLELISSLGSLLLSEDHRKLLEKIE